MNFKSVLPVLCLFMVPCVSFGATKLNAGSNTYSYNGDVFTDGYSGSDDDQVNKIQEMREIDVIYRSNGNWRFGNYRRYIGARADLSFLNWKNEYKTATEEGSDNFSFKPVIGADIFVGYRFTNNWRVDAELGYMGHYNETETEYYIDPVYLTGSTEKTTFDLETYYLMANGYYDFNYGLYVGAGLGAAFVNVSLDNSELSKASKTNTSLMGSLMFGWAYELDDKVDLDLRYRLALFNGGELKNDTGAGTFMTTDLGLIMDNSLSVGVRYKF